MTISFRFMTNKTKWLLITIAIQFLLMAGIFRNVLFHPNEYFFEAGEDVIKSLMCMAYYIKYDHGLHFTGEIYPYGDHVMYADTHFPVRGIESLTSEQKASAVRTVAASSCLTSPYGLQPADRSQCRFQVSQEGIRPGRG